MKWKDGQATGRTQEFLVSEHSPTVFHLYSRAIDGDGVYGPLGTYKSCAEAKKFAGYFNDQSETV